MGATGETNPYEIGLDKNAANFVPLTPLGFLSRSAAVFPDRAAVVYGERRIVGARLLSAAVGLPRRWRRTG